MANFHKTVLLESGVMRKHHAPFGGGQKEKQMMLLTGCLPYVVHHALCNLIEPIFEWSFIHDSYANRVGKGAHRALDRAQAYARRYRYVLACDVVQFFPSVDHQILRGILARVLRDRDVMWLVVIALAFADHNLLSSA